LVAREWSETVQSGRRVTAKRWSEGWYSDRYDHTESVAEVFLSEAERERVAAFVERTGIRSVASICGKLRLDPSKADRVEAVVEGEG